MKKNKFIVFVNWILLFSLPAILMTSNISTDQVKSDQETKNLATSLFTKIEEKSKNELVINSESFEEAEDIEIEEIKEKQQVPKKEESVVSPPPKVEEVIKEEPSSV